MTLQTADIQVAMDAVAVINGSKRSTISELARCIDVDRSTIHRYITGARRPDKQRYDMLVSLINFYNDSKSLSKQYNRDMGILKQDLKQKLRKLRMEQIKDATSTKSQ